MRSVFVFAPDLMDRSRISAAIPHAQFVTDVEQLARVDQAGVVLVDLGRPRVLEAIPKITGSVVGFASHVDEALMVAARAAGCAEVLPRSRFFRRLADFATDTGQTDRE